MNGYYIEVALCTIIGILWYNIFRGVLQNLQTKDYTHWLVNIKKPVKKNDKNIYSISVN
jgi:PAT family acetyl-CoA transporter-like MFS transporter 1